MAKSEMPEEEKASMQGGSANILIRTRAGLSVWCAVASTNYFGAAAHPSYGSPIKAIPWEHLSVLTPTFDLAEAGGTSGSIVQLLQEASEVADMATANL
jgi:hypothetical protein